MNINNMPAIAETFEDYRYTRSTIQDKAMKEQYDLVCPVKEPPALPSPVWRTIELSTRHDVERYNRELLPCEALNITAYVVRYLTVIPDHVENIEVSDIQDDVDEIVERITTLIPEMKLSSMMLVADDEYSVFMTAGTRTCNLNVSADRLPCVKQLPQLVIHPRWPSGQAINMSAYESLTDLSVYTDIVNVEGCDLINIRKLNCGPISSHMLSQLISIESLHLQYNGEDLDLSVLPTGSLKSLFVRGANITGTFSEAPLLEELRLHHCDLSEPFCALPQLLLLATELSVEEVCPVAPLLNNISIHQGNNSRVKTRASLRTLCVHDYDDDDVDEQPELTTLDSTITVETNIKTYPALRYMTLGLLDTATSSVQPAIRKLVIEEEGEVVPNDAIANQVFGTVPYEYVNKFGYVRALD
jgi:hypothetical protein